MQGVHLDICHYLPWGPGLSFWMIFQGVKIPVASALFELMVLGYEYQLQYLQSSQRCVWCGIYLKTVTQKEGLIEAA